MHRLKMGIIGILHFIIVLVFLVLLALVCLDGASLPKAGCTISVNQHLTEPQALILYQNGATKDIEAFPLPVDSKGTLNFDAGETLDIACPGGLVHAYGISLDSEVIEATCISGKMFSIQGIGVDYDSLTCSKATAHMVRYTGKTCAGNNKEVEIGFSVEKRFIRHITTCYDPNLQQAIYARNEISPAIQGTQVNYPRPSFQVSSFYNVKPDSVATLYTKNGQRETINRILGLSVNDSSIVQESGNFYLATGHYTPKGDFVYGAQQRLTFYYVNAAPQWHTLNAGNWYTMEANVRNLATVRGNKLVVYTGTYGVSSLPDVNGIERELYLWKNPDVNRVGIPVPAIFYKVVYEPASQLGVALLSLNNPYKKVVQSDEPCQDVSNQVSWLTWKRDNVTLGYSYCCEVTTFRKTIPNLPNFAVKGLLK